MQSDNEHEVRLQTVRQQVDAFFARQQAGNIVTAEEYCAVHPELMPELADQLRLARMVLAARDNVADGKPHSSLPDSLRHSANTEEHASTPSRSSGDTAAHATAIDCPHCHTRVSATDATDWHCVTCPSCGNEFGLVGDDDTTSDLSPGHLVGRFELIAIIGRGGFGSVWKARDPQLDREVAVKFPRRGELTAAEAEWFLREARNAAQIQHPNIVSVHEVGRDGDRIYLVSDFIEGETLADRIRRQPLRVREAAEMAHTIASALSHIHASQIVHRDLKPGNILIDRQGTPYVADFGLAHRRQTDITLTLDGNVLGTPAYMSPEQARGDSHDADARSDIYSLGIVLFEMLTGELPFRGLPHAIFDQVINDEPPNPRRLNPLVPRDLATICLKCLEKSPEKRFATASDLADELARFQSGEPIHSRPVNLIERAWRWSRRRPFAAALIGVFCGLSIVAPIAAIRYRSVAVAATKAQQAMAASEREKSELLYSFQMRAVQEAMEQSETPDISRAGQLLDRQIPAPGSPDLRDFEWYYWQAKRKQGLLWERTIPRPKSLAVSSDGQWLAIGSLTGFVHIEHLSRGEAFELSPSIPADDRPVGVYCIDFSPDSRLLAIGTGARLSIVDVFDVKTRDRVASLQPQGAWIHDLKFSPDGELLVAGTVNGGTLEFWKQLDPESHEAITVTENSVIELEFSRQGDRLAIGTEEYGGKGEGAIRIMDVASREVIAECERATNFPCLAKWTADGQHLLTARHHQFTIDKRVVDSLKPLPVKYELESNSRVGQMAISPDHRQLVAGGYDGTLVSWNLASGGNVRRNWPGHSKTVTDIAFLPDGKQLVTCSQDGHVRGWSAETAPAVELPLEFPGPINTVLFSPDGRTLFVLGRWDDKAKLTFALCAWDITNGKRQWLVELPGAWSNAMTITPDGSELITGHRFGKVRRWNTQTGELIDELQLHPDDPECLADCLAISPDGTQLASGQGSWQNKDVSHSLTEEVVIVDLQSNTVQARWQAHDRKVCRVLFGPGPDEVLTTGWDKTVRRWSISTGELIAEYQLGLRNARGLHVVDANRRLVAIDSDGTIWRWSLQDHQPLEPITQRSGFSSWSALSPLGHTLAIPLGVEGSVAAARPGKVKLFDTRTWEPKTTLATPGPPNCCSFSPDGRHLAAGDPFGSVYLWRGVSTASAARE